MERFSGELDLLQRIGLTHSEAQVYIALSSGYTKVKGIVEETRMKRPSVYYAITQLEHRGLVGRMKVGEYNQWQLSDPHMFTHLLESSEHELERTKKDLAAYLQTLANKPEIATPKITYYQGRESIARIVFDSLYTREKQILSIAPRKNFFFQIGPEFAEKYVAERKQRAIRTRNLWEELMPKEILEKRYRGLSEIRLLPHRMHNQFKTTTFIYDNKVMYIAPLESNYAVIFESPEHVSMMKAFFETLWSISKPAFK